MTADPPPTAELLRLRTEMDALNARLSAVLQERARLCRRIAAHKRASGLPAADAAREQAMLAATLAAAGGDGFDRAALERILRAVFDESRALVQAAARSPAP